jgi:hypothetical protein
MMLAAVILTLSHLPVAWLPLVAALWGMVLVTSHREWGHHRQLVREATLSPAAHRLAGCREARGRDRPPASVVPSTGHAPL